MQLAQQKMGNQQSGPGQPGKKDDKVKRNPKTEIYSNLIQLSIGQGEEKVGATRAYKGWKEEAKRTRFNL